MQSYLIFVVVIVFDLAFSGIDGFKHDHDNEETEKQLAHATELIDQCRKVEIEIARKSSVISAEWNTIQTLVGEIYKQLNHNQSIVESTLQLVEHMDTLKHVLLHKDSNNNNKRRDELNHEDRQQVARLIVESVKLNEAAQLVLSHHHSVRLHLNSLESGLSRVVEVLRGNITDRDLFDIYRHVLTENINLVQSAIQHISHSS